jgi:hypothetical protein
MIDLKSITITRAEGPTDLCDKPHTFDSWDAARHWLLRQRPTYSAQGYDKHDCTVTWEDGSSYSLRLDCTRDGDDCDVAERIRDACAWRIQNPLIVCGKLIPSPTMEWCLEHIPGFESALP